MTRPTTVVGIDLSLTSTGIAAVEFLPGGAWSCTLRRVRSAGTAGDLLVKRATRLNHILVAVLGETAGADLAVIEGPAYASRHGRPHDRSGLWWLTVSALLDAGVPVAEVPPTNRAAYATGKGNAGKDAVLAATIRRYPDIEVTGNDVADAVVLAAMGARHLGHPIETSLPQTHLRAMDTVSWPATDERNPLL
jgi:crossover junction endodeoxyribonuclease RuvC